MWVITSSDEISRGLYCLFKHTEAVTCSVKKCCFLTNTCFAVFCSLLLSFSFVEHNVHPKVSCLCSNTDMQVRLNLHLCIKTSMFMGKNNFTNVIFFSDCFFYLCFSAVFPTVATKRSVEPSGWFMEEVNG